MKRWGFPFGFLLIALGWAFYYQQQQSSGRAGFPAPDFTLTDIAGRPHHLTDYRGKIVFLNVWATWCPPCREEMPSMEELYQRLRGKEFAMLAVSQDEDGVAAVKPFVDQMGLTFPVLIDRRGVVSTRYGVTGYPETFIIDRDGQVIQHIIGPADWQDEQTLQYFTRLLDTAVATSQVAGKDAQPAN
jgi:peroxiredoxin